MRMDAIERRQPGGQQQEPDQLPCPRCDSTNTKFCYYNNYNLSQPRHFCKACRRYWTQGGTLRNIPVGGGSRKNSKRSRASGPTPSPPVSSVHAAMDQASKQPEVSFGGGGMAQTGAPGSFTSLLSSQGSGFLALAGLDDMGYVMGPGDWPYNETAATATTGACSGGGWGFGGVECGFFDGDCFTWPDLSISMPVKGFK